jgi:hypothetical protein
MAYPKIVYPSSVTNPSGPFTTLSFTYPATKIPGFDLSWVGERTTSAAGLQQTITQRVDNLFPLTMEFVLTGSDVAAWLAFCEQAIQGVAFDFYADASVDSFTTYLDTDDRLTTVYKAPGGYTLVMKWREYIAP